MIILSFLLLILSLSEYNGFSKKQTRLLKAFLPFLVITSHYFPISFFETDISSLGCFAVSIFFFISGYGLTYKYQKDKSLSIHYIIDKLLVLFIPLVTSGIVYSLLVYYNEGINAWKYFIVNLQKGYFIFPISWFVCKLIILYVLFYLTSKVKNSLIVLFVLIVLCMITERLLGIQATYFMSDLAFGGGCMFFNFEKRKRINIMLFKVGYIITVVILLLQIKGTIYFTNLLLPIFAVPLFCCISFKENIVSKFLSNISYELYLVQTSSELILSNYIHNALLAFVLIVILSIILSYILHKVDMKILSSVKCFF